MGRLRSQVQPAPPDHEIRQRYEIHEADLTDPQFPWRHSPAKLSRAIMHIVAPRQTNGKEVVQATI